MDIYRQLRICRRHFDDDSKNGACRRLLNTAVPTLHMNDDARTDESDKSALNESFYLEEEYIISDNIDVIENQNLDVSTGNPLKRGVFDFSTHLHLHSSPTNRPLLLSIY